jgi:hypothetical protein
MTVIDWVIQTRLTSTTQCLTWINLWFSTTRFVEPIEPKESLLHKETLDLNETFAEATAGFLFDCFDARTASSSIFFSLAP